MGAGELQGDAEARIAALIDASDKGDRAAGEALFTVLYSELHRIAKHELARRNGAVSISATTLLHEAYLAMSRRAVGSFPEPARFMGYAAKVMRRLIIDHARERHAHKRGGLFEITSLHTNVEPCSVNHAEIAEIGEALEELYQAEPALAEVVDLKFFCGLSFAEIAALRQLSERTVQRNWERARLYLFRKISAELPA